MAVNNADILSEARDSSISMLCDTEVLHIRKKARKDTTFYKTYTTIQKIK